MLAASARISADFTERLGHALHRHQIAIVQHNAHCILTESADSPRILVQCWLMYMWQTHDREPCHLHPFT